MTAISQRPAQRQKSEQHRKNVNLRASQVGLSVGILGRAEVSAVLPFTLLQRSQDPARVPEWGAWVRETARAMADDLGD